MKKFISILIAVVLVSSFSTVALAADQSTTLTYSVDADYIVTIPESVKLDETIEITSAKANTEPGMAVKVRISEGLTDGKVTLSRQNDTDYKITSLVKLNNTDAVLDSTSVIASFADVTETTTGGTLAFAAPVSPDGGEVKAGDYTGTITFAISYEAE